MKVCFCPQNSIWNEPLGRSQGTRLSYIFFPFCTALNSWGYLLKKRLLFSHLLLCNLDVEHQLLMSLLVLPSQTTPFFFPTVSDPVSSCYLNYYCKGGQATSFTKVTYLWSEPFLPAFVPWHFFLSHLQNSHLSEQLTLLRLFFKSSWSLDKNSSHVASLFLF